MAMSFVKLADNVYQLSGFLPHAINAYVIEGVLIDARTRWAGGSLLRQLRGLDITAHALTHAHPDHQGLWSGRMFRRNRAARIFPRGCFRSARSLYKTANVAQIRFDLSGDRG